ncbi:MAG: NAD(P)H-hydrate dehydratase [Abditibacteriota bacterium]|nr:NAD(P)H-hydrate dehydratase [Abditibacteriota bacterium]
MDRVCAMAEDIRRMDSHCVRTLGMPAAVLMENAGRGAAREIVSRMAPCRAAVLAGKGNNGGDGFVIARHLSAAGFDAAVFCIGAMEGLSEEAALNRELLKALGIRMISLDPSGPLPEHMAEINSAPLVVDAVYGVGFRGSLRESVKPFARALHPEGAVFCVDMPSGIDSDTGRGEALMKADFTLAMEAPKPGLYLYPGRKYAGEVIRIGLGVPWRFEDPSLPRLKESFSIPPREPDCYKGSFAHVGIVGGRLGMTGAAILAAKSALCCGAGLVSVASPSAWAHIYETAVSDAMTCPVKSSEGYGDDPGELLEFAAGKDTVAIGPGFGRSSREFVREFLRRCPVPMVVDADALWCAGNDPGLLEEIGPKCVFTPHYGEMSYLTGLSIEEIKADKLKAAAGFARRYNTCLVLKGPDTVTAYPGKTFINTSGCPAMAGPGFGDVLCGMIASGAASPEDMVFLHGLAGQRAAEELSEACVRAEDIIRYIPVCIKERSTL